MKKIIVMLIVFPITSFTLEIKSTEEIRYVSIKDTPLIGMMKTDAFVGAIERTEEENPDLRMVDYYEFTGTKNSKLTKKTCEVFLARIFGPLKEITLKVKIEKFSDKLIQSDPVCEAVALDPDPDSKIPERRILLGVKKGAPFALVFKLSKKSEPSILENTRNFLKSLK